VIKAEAYMQLIPYTTCYWKCTLYQNEMVARKGRKKCNNLCINED